MSQQDNLRELISALGFKETVMEDETGRRVILDDAKHLRPAMVAARRRASELDSLLSDAHMEAREERDEIAEALGISTGADDWWEYPKEQHAKILGRISVLRGLKVSPKLP